jgi:hypothetical protein
MKNGNIFDDDVKSINMDNNMTAIVSVLMIGVGFINGMIMSTLLDKSEADELHRQLLKERQKSASLQGTIEDLEEAVETLERDNAQIIRVLSTIVDRSRGLAPPEGPLDRSSAELGPQDEEFCCPTSPDASP